MKIDEVLEKSIKKLNENNIEEATNKARRLLAFVLNVKKEYLVTHNNQELSFEQIEKFNKYIDEIIEGKPIQYIIGIQEFMGINFNVNENVLIPQPDTEILVEEAIKIAKTYKEPKILDLCTGSGSIAVALSRYVEKAKIFASDISKNALEVAKSNDTEKKVIFINSDMFDNIQEKFDIIVSNPPYIKTQTIKSLSKEVKREPIIALDGGEDGLVFYRKIVDNAYKFINHNGYLCLEIGEDQKEEVTKIIANNNNYYDIKAYKDLADNDRVIICRKT